MTSGAIDREKDSADSRICQIAADAAVAVMAERAPLLAEQLKEQILREYAGRRITKGTACKRETRNRHICEQAAAGRGVDVLAMAFRLTPGQIRRILRQAKK